MMKAVAVFLWLSATGVASASKGWGYGHSTSEAYGPNDWKIVNPTCGKTRQSPINLGFCWYKRFAKELSAKYYSIEGDRDNDKVDGTLVNNGHAPVLNINNTKGAYILSGGPLGSLYKLQQFHFHFGCGRNEGSEHTLWNLKYPGELHLVFYNMKYLTFEKAADKPDGLAVIGVFLDFVQSHWHVNRGLKVLVSNFNKIIKKGSSVEVKNFEIKDLVPQLSDLSEYQYYTYKGSLTTPPCYESVRWIVLKRHVIPISAKEIEMFRLLQADHGYIPGKMCNNYRPVQPRNGRFVYCTNP